MIHLLRVDGKFVSCACGQVKKEESEEKAQKVAEAHENDPVNNPL